MSNRGQRCQPGADLSPAASSPPRDTTTGDGLGISRTMYGSNTYLVQDPCDLYRGCTPPSEHSRDRNNDPHSISSPASSDSQASPLGRPPPEGCSDRSGCSNDQCHRCFVLHWQRGIGPLIMGSIPVGMPPPKGCLDRWGCNDHNCYACQGAHARRNRYFGRD